MSNVQRIQANLQGLSQDEPWLEQSIAGSPAAMAISQEVAAGLHETSISNYAISAMIGDNELKPFDDVIDRLDNNSDLVGQFFQDYSGDLNPMEKNFLAYILAPLDADRKDQTLALTHQYIETNGIDTDEQRANVMVYAAQIADGKFNEAAAETNTFLGRLGAVVDRSGRPLRERVSRIWAQTADPSESTYREHLSLGQNMAITLGQTPGTSGFQTTSGVSDGIAQLVIDPTNLIIGLGAGSKLAKTFPRIADGGRTITALRAAVPWFGRDVANLPRFSRGLTTRIGWALRSRTVDDLVDSSKLADQLFNAAQQGGIAKMIENFPVMSNALDGIGDLIARAGSKDEVADILKEALSGGFLEGGKGLDRLKNAFEQAETTYNRAVDEALDSGEIGLGDVGGFDGFQVDTARVFSYEGEVRPGMGLGVSTLENTGETRLVLRGAEKTLDLTDDTEAAAVARWLQENGTETGDTVLANRILSGNYSFTEQMVARLDAYAVSAGADTISFGDNVILTSKGADRAVTGIDKTTDATRLVELTRDMASDLIDKRHKYSTALKGDTDLWVLNEMPAGPPKGLMRQVKGLWRNTASNDSNSWWAQSRRIRSAQIFNKQAPNAISIDNTSEMIEGFRRLARSYGASRGWINRKINELAGTKFMDRYDAVSRAITELAEQVDHPLLRHRLVEYVRDQATREFMPGMGGAETAIAASRADGVTQTAVPLIPSLMRRSVQLPGPDFHRSFMRYRKAKDSNIPFLRRGVTAGTRRKRKAIVDTIRRRLRAKAKANPDLKPAIDELVRDDDRLFAMAYGSVMNEGGIGNGVGLLAKFGAGLGKGLYTPIHSVFSVAQLAFRPVSWMLRVNLDEQARGALFDLPSIFRNPARYTQSWWDAYHVAKAEKWAAANSTWMAQTAEAIMRGGDAAIDDIVELFPDARKVLGDAPTERALRNFVNQQLRDIAQGRQPIRGLAGQMDLGRWATRRVRQRARGLKRVRKVEEKYGLAPEFVWDDASEIQMKGTHQLLVEEMAGSVAPVEWGMNVTQRGAYDFGTAWASKGAQYVNDPVIRVAMRASVRRARGGSIRQDAAAIVRSKNWHEMRQNYLRVARQYGWDDVTGNDVDLAERILDKILMPQVDHIFSPMWNMSTDAVSTKARILEDLLSPNRSATFTAHDGIEYTFDFRKGGGQPLREEMRRFTGEEHARMSIPGSASAGMPDRIAAYFDPLYASDDGRKGIPAAWRKFTDWSIGTFGERATQGLNRRPAYLAAHGRSFRRFKALGLDDDAARMAAHGEAVRLVNYVYYNMDDTVPILRKMNKIIPFFSAAWEVAQTWAYKIPKELAGGAGFMLGWPRMARSVDRYFDAFINAGLLRVDEGEEDDKWRGYSLVLAQDLGLGEAMPVSNFLSAAGNHIANTPFTIIEHLVNISNDLPVIGGVLPDEDVELGSDDIRLRVAAPIDPLGEGVGNALSFHLGVNPLISYAAARYKDDIYAAIDGKTYETAGQSFATIEETTGIDAAEMLRANKLVIQDAIGKDEYAKLERGETEIDDYTLPSGLNLRIPRSSLVGGVVDELFFAFDSSPTLGGTFYHMQPSWSKYIWRGLGLWAGNDGHPPGFLEYFDGPTGDAQMRSAVVDALRRLEANEGAVSRLDEARNKLGSFVKEMENVLIVDATTGDVRGIEGVDPDLVASASETFQDLWEDVNDRSEYLLGRAGDLAGGQLLTRGVFGLFMPSNPQTFATQSHLEDIYYTSQDFVAGEAIPEIRNATDYETFATLMTAWWEDETGDAAKLILQELYPGMEMWWKGKYYWVDGTQPIESSEIEDHFAQVAAGLKEVKPPEVFLLDEARGGMSLLKEAEIRDRFGVGAEGVQNILTNYGEFQALGEEIELGYAELEWFDDLFFDGAYADYMSRERRTAPRLVEELKLATIDKFRNLDDMSGLIADIVDATPDEQMALSRQLSQARRETRDLIYDLMDSPEYEGAITDRERILTQWWAEVDKHYDAADAIFGQLDDPTLTSEERGLVFEQWRMYQNDQYGKPIVIDGVEYPNEFERSWASKSDEEKRQKRLRDIGKRPEWLSLYQIDHLTEQYPEAAEYLPSDTALYDQLTEFKDTTKAAVEAGEISQYRANEANSKATELFNALMLEEGRVQELKWINATPLERLELIEDVPPYLEAVMPYYHNLVGTLRANDISLKSTSADARKIKGAFYGIVADHLANVPGGAQQFLDLGLTMFGDDFDAPDEIAAVLFFNDRFSDL